MRVRVYRVYRAYRLRVWCLDFIGFRAKRVLYGSFMPGADVLTAKNKARDL